MLRSCFWIGLLSMLAAGCQSTEPPPAVDEPSPASAPSAVPTPASAASEQESSTAPIADEPSEKVAEFAPPFPARIELFVAPRSGQGNVRRDEEHGETIELKGFIDVDGPQVLLAIDGVLSPIREGGEKYGVHVISIDPPQVVLQRGRNRWTASLE